MATMMNYCMRTVYVSNSDLNKIHFNRATQINYSTSTVANAAKDKLKALIEDADTQLLRYYYCSNCTLSPSDTKDDNHPNLVLRLYNESGALDYYMDPQQSTNWTIASDLKIHVIKTFIQSAYKLNFSYSGVTPGGEADTGTFSTRIITIPYTLSPVRSTFDLWTEIGLLCTGMQSNIMSTNNQYTLISPITSTTASCQRPASWPQPSAGGDYRTEYSPSLIDTCEAIVNAISDTIFISSAAASHPSMSSTGTATKTTWEYDGASTSISSTFTIT